MANPFIRCPHCGKFLATPLHISDTIEEEFSEKNGKGEYFRTDVLDCPYCSKSCVVENQYRIEFEKVMKVGK